MVCYKWSRALTISSYSAAVLADKFLLLIVKQDCGVHTSKMVCKCGGQRKLEHVSVLLCKGWHNVMIFHYS